MSGFNVRGSIWMGKREYVDARVPGGLNAVLEAMDNDDVRVFFSQTFLPGTWVDVFPMVPVTEAIARATGMTFEASLARSGEFQAERDMRGIFRLLVHRLLLQKATPNMVVDRYPQIYRQYYDFGSMDNTRHERGSVTTRITGFPEAVAEWWIRATGAYLERVLQDVGARTPKVSFDAPQPEGLHDAHPLVSITMNTSWT
jgi:hypothetical protein